MATNTAEKPVETEDLFSRYYYRLARYGNDKAFYPKSMNKRAEREIIILAEERRTRLKKPIGTKVVSVGEVDYIVKLHEYVEKMYDGTEYKLEEAHIKLIKKTFDNEWLRDKKKIPYTYTEEYLNKKCD